MIRRSDFSYGRRIFGSRQNTKEIGPRKFNIWIKHQNKFVYWIIDLSIVNKQSVLPGLPSMINGTQSVNKSNADSENLMKGNGFLNKYPSKIVKENISTKNSLNKIVEQQTKDEEIVIHVWDEKKKIEKDFKCKKNILLKEMKYFEKHLKMTDSADDIDISIHCDIKIFEWLMSYISDLSPKLEVNNVIPIWISADFLIMKRLNEEWVRFIVKNISEIVKIPIDMNWLNEYTLRSISEAVSIEELDLVKDQRDCLQSKLFSYKLEEILRDESNMLNWWMYCNTLFTSGQSEWMTCPRAEIFIDYRGRVLAKHVADKNWIISEFFDFMNKNGVSWRRIFWKVWSRLKDDEWLTCGQRFTYAEFNHWTYHPDSPQFSFGSNIGVYEWWLAEAVRFSTHSQNNGWISRSHVPKNLKVSSNDSKFIERHKEIFVETSIEIKSNPKEIEEIKSDWQNQNNNDEKVANSQSNVSLAKPKKKMRLMSLMEILLEFITAKSSNLYFIFVY